MKKFLTIMLLATLSATAHSQEANERLHQLETYLKELEYGVSHEQSNTHERGITHRWRTSFPIYLLPHPSNNGNMSEEQRQKVIHSIDSINARREQQMNKALDSIRIAFAALGKYASESYLYEYHKDGTDTIKYSLAFRQEEDSLYSSRYGNQVYFHNAREVASFDYQKGYDSNYNRVNGYGSYQHVYTIPNGITWDDLKPFDFAAFEAQIQPVLKTLKKLKGSKTYPVYWRHDEGFEDNVGNGGLISKVSRQSEYGDNKHTGLTTGTHYFIPIQYKSEAEAIYHQLDSLTHNYVDNHPEQQYTYYYSSRFLPHANITGIVEGHDIRGDKDYHLKCMMDEEGYHILVITTKGELWTPKDWQKLKSYINGEKVYRKE